MDMQLSIRSRRYFYVGLIYLLFGLLFLFFAMNYHMGSVGKMGPGYVPAMLAILLIGVGGASVVLSLVLQGTPLPRTNVRAVLLVLCGVCSFAFLLERAGLVIALVALLALSTAASRQNRADAATLGIIALLVALCALVFVHGLGVPMPYRGTWWP